MKVPYQWDMTYQVDISAEILDQMVFFSSFLNVYDNSMNTSISKKLPCLTRPSTEKTQDLDGEGLKAEVEKFDEVRLPKMTSDRYTNWIFSCGCMD